MSLSRFQRTLLRGEDLVYFDGFSGIGGWTEAVERTGDRVSAAVNHWDKAVMVHAANHPSVEHRREQLDDTFDYCSLPDFNAAVLSPSCQGHSNAGQMGRAASGDVTAAHDKLRATAWAVSRCLHERRPEVCVVENVAEFMRWEQIEAWKMSITCLGYSLTEQVLLASKWNTPQRRHRVIYVAHHEGAPIHLRDPDVPERSLRGVFDRSAGGWKDISSMKPRSPKNKSPYLTAREKAEVSDARLRGRLGWGQHTNYNRWGLTTDAPAPTLTTVPGLMFWTKAGRYRQWTDGELLAASTFSRDYDLCGVTRKDASRLIGNAVPPEFGRGILEAVKAEALRLIA